MMKSFPFTNSKIEAVMTEVTLPLYLKFSTEIKFQMGSF